MTDKHKRREKRREKRRVARPSFREMPFVGKKGEKMPNGQRFVSMRVKFLGVLGVTGMSVVLAALILIPLTLRVFGAIYDRPERSVARMDRYVRNFADYVAREQLSSTDNAEIVRYTRLHRLIYITVFTDGTGATDPPTESTTDSAASSGVTEGGGLFGSLGDEDSSTYEPFFDRLFPGGEYDATDPADGTRYSVRFANGMCSVTVVDNSYPILCDAIVVGGVILAVAIFFVVVLLYYHSQTRAIVTLAREVESVSNGATYATITPDRNDEIGMLARDVDIMRRTVLEKMDEQDRAWQANRDLLTSMTHDLRTPLTTLLGYMELLGNDRQDNLTDEQRAYIRVCTGKAEQIKALSDKLFLYFWAYNRPDSDLHAEAFDADLLFGQLIGDYIPAMEGAGLSVEADLSAIPTGSAVRVDPDCLRRVTDNLFDNLTKYADPSDPVRVTASVRSTPADTVLVIALANTVARTTPETAGTHIGHKTCHNMMSSMRGSFSAETVGDRFTAELTLPLYLD